MRAAPALQLTVERFRAWRAAVSLLLLLSGASVFAWCWWQRGQLEGWWLIGAAMLYGVTALGAVTVLLAGPYRLRWDGEQWHLQRPPGAESKAGTVHPVVDLGPWMLLRFDASAAPRHAAAWLPVGRRGLESEWHGFRCAVYSPRFQPGQAAVDAAAPALTPPRAIAPNERS